MCGVTSRRGEARGSIYRLSVYLHGGVSQICSVVVFGSGGLPEMSRVEGENRVVNDEVVEDNAKVAGSLRTTKPGLKRRPNPGELRPFRSSR